MPCDELKFQGTVRRRNEVCLRRQQDRRYKPDRAAPDAGLGALDCLLLIQNGRRLSILPSRVLGRGLLRLVMAGSFGFRIAHDGSIVL
jgi:hypothetical protein